MDFNFSEVINQETEYRQPPVFTPPPIETPPPGSHYSPAGPVYTEPEPEPGPPVNPELTAQTWIAGLDSFNYIIWFMLNQRKLRAKYFNNEEEYDKAETYHRKTPTEISKLEDAEKATHLLERYQKYLTRLEARTSQIPLNEEERKLLEKPLIEMAKRNANFDLPPWAALMIAGASITVPRFIIYQQPY